MNSNSDPHSEIAAVQRHFLRQFATNDIAGIAACYTEDAQMLVANMDAVIGRAAIESVFKFTAVSGHTLQFQTQELDVHGASAVELGRYTRTRSDGSIFDRGKYIVIWKRIGNAWLIHRDMFSTSMPKAAVLTPA
jgi:ketosteroid isomerase-like protein